MSLSRGEYQRDRLKIYQCRLENTMTKKIVAICLLLLLATHVWGQWDWYGFYFDDPPLNEEHYIIGTEFNVFRSANVWSVVVFTSYEMFGFFVKSPVMLWFDERPIVNDGDRIETYATYSGLWKHGGNEMPTFRIVARTTEKP